MELKEFIKNALVDIIKAVEEAKGEVSDKDSICPFITPALAKDYKLYFDHINRKYYQRIDFDIAVSAVDQNENGGKVGIRVLGIEANIGGNNNFSNTTVSRIKFNIPISLNCKE